MGATSVDTWGKDNVLKKKRKSLKLPKNVFNTIETIINRWLDKEEVSYEDEKKEIIEACNNPSKIFETKRYEADLEIFDEKNNNWYVFEMKGPAPNTSQVESVKRRLLTFFSLVLFEFWR